MKSTGLLEGLIRGHGLARYLIGLILLVGSVQASADFTRKFNYSGRLTDVNGKPVQGPIDIQVQFFRVASGGSAVPGILVPIYEDVNLVQGVFEISIDLPGNEVQLLFDGNPVFVQITDISHNQVYPRQELSVMPYALKVPVDDETISYNSDGELIINSLNSDQIDDGAINVSKIAPCTNTNEILKWDGTTWICAPDEIGANGTVDITSVSSNNGLTGGAATGDVTLGIAANGVTTNRLADAAVETVKIAAAAVTSDKLANSSVSSDKITDAAITVAKLASCTNADEILKWNGSAWACAADADTNAGGDITGVNANDGLTGGGSSGALTVGIAANGVTTNRLADAAVETAKIADAAVNSDKLANASVYFDKIINGSVGTDKIADAAITVAKLAACTNADEILKWNGSAWACAADADTNSGGDITGVAAGSGLSGGGGTGAVTLDLDITDLTAEASVDDSDLIPIYDTSASAHRKMTRSDLISGLEKTSNKGGANGYASLDASSKVEQDPANAQTTPASGKIPMTGAGTTIDKDWYPTMTGDSGAGGAKGAVPAPATGDAAAGRFLKADGTWAVPTSGTFTMNNNTYIATDEIRARDAGGLVFADDSGTASLTVNDGGSLTASGFTTVNQSSMTVYTPSDGLLRRPANIALRLQNNADMDGTGSFLEFAPHDSSTVVKFSYFGGIAEDDGYGSTMVFGRRSGQDAYGETMRIEYDGDVGIGTSTPGKDLVGTYDLPASAKTLELSGNGAHIIARGTGESAIDLIDSGANANEKWMQINTNDGVTKLRSIQDDGTTATDNVAINHATGAVTIANNLVVHLYLKQTFNFRKLKNPKYSLRSMARDLGLSPSSLSDLFNKEQALTEKKALEVADHLQLIQAEKDYFVELVRLKKSKSEAERQKVVQRMNVCRFEIQSLMIREDWLTIIKEWYHVAILELVKVEGFRCDADWIANRLGISAIQAETALGRLKKVGFLKEVDGNLELASEVFTSSQAVPSSVIRDLHQQVLRLAQSSIQKHPVEMRDNSFVFFAMDQSQLEACRTRLQDFRRELVSDLEQAEKKDSVYCIAVSLFPIDKS